ncbi:MAG: hypothetical protein K9H61_00035 [Bacteroidia bacterium]|nr:hypothetical protein [Bacteroidia bacterium]MCF8426053.1 hypothetical protein [Bacteroidia bacterium]MCF8445352.1 hypothetical protein [Bacteroidia bacterium]
MKSLFNKNGIIYYAVFSFFILVLPSCATYYQKNEKFMTAVYQSNFEAVNKILADDASWEKHDKNKLLFYLNKGTVLWMQGQNAQSNTYFSKADLFIEDYDKKVGDVVLTMLMNPKMSTYPGESFEQILLHYYGALNYLSLGQTDEALVEGKRMLEKMQRITDKYQGKNKYKRDAFAHNLLGIIYDARKEYNDAFIAYRTAYEIYNEDYSAQLQTPTPLQLKKDILRTALATGFFDEVKKYEAEFGIKAESANKENGNLVFFWNNGLGPIKDQINIDIMIIPYGNGLVQFVYPELGISMTFPGSQEQNKGLLDMKYIRMALPKYVSREPYYTSANLTIDSMDFTFQLAENVNNIAYRSLADRMGKEIAMGLTRVALKQLAIHQAKNEEKSGGLAAAAMIYGAVSEQADTRNWQLLPYSINYARVSKPAGTYKVKFEAETKDRIKGATRTYDVKIIKGATTFIATQTIEFAGYSGK